MTTTLVCQKASPKVEATHAQILSQYVRASRLVMAATRISDNGDRTTAITAFTTAIAAYPALDAADQTDLVAWYTAIVAA